MPKVRYDDGTEIFVPSTDPDTLERSYQDYHRAKETTALAPELERGTREIANRGFNPQGLIPDPVVKYGYPVAGYAAGLGLSKVPAGGHIGAGLGAAAGQMELNRRARMKAARAFHNDEPVSLQQTSPVETGVMTGATSAVLGGAFRAGRGLYRQLPGPAKRFGERVSGKVGEYAQGAMDRYGGALERVTGQNPGRGVDISPAIQELRAASTGAPPVTGPMGSGGVYNVSSKEELMRLIGGADPTLAATPGIGMTARNPQVASQMTAAIRNYRAQRGIGPGVKTALERFIENPELAANATAAEAQEVANILRMAPGVYSKIGSGGAPASGGAAPLADFRRQVIDTLGDAFPELAGDKAAYFASREAVRDVAPSLGGPGTRAFRHPGESAARPADIVGRARAIFGHPKGSMYASPGRSASAQEVVGPELMRQVGDVRAAGIGGKGASILAVGELLRRLVGKSASYPIERAAIGE